jgi:hypothetical protein
MSRFERFVIAGCCAAVLLIMCGAIVSRQVNQAQRDAAMAQEMCLRQAAELEALQ